MVGRWEREKILPAREKWPVFVEFEGAGRVLYRLGLEVGVAGRVLYRLGLEVGVQGEFCTACGLAPRASALYGARWPNFVAWGCHMGCCWEGFVWVLGGVADTSLSGCVPAEREVPVISELVVV